MSEKLAHVLAGITTAHVSTDLGAGVATGLAHATERLAERMVGAAVAMLRENGVAPSDLSFGQFMHFAANFHLERYRSIGLLEKDRFTAPRLAAVEERLKAGPKLAEPEECRSFAFFLDVAAYARRHYLPTVSWATRLMETASAPEIPPAEPCEPAPYSPEALACRARLTSIRFVHYKTKPVIHEPKSMAELLAEPFLPEELAARLVHCAPKTLADRRRAGLVDPKVLAPRVEAGTVLYDTMAWIAANRPRPAPVVLPDLPKAGRSRPMSTELPDLPKRAQRLQRG